MNVFIIAATSIDGFIAEKTDQSSLSWTSKEDRRFFVQRTKQARVMIFGSTTFKTMGRALPGRLNIVYTKNPEQFADFTKEYDASELRITQEDPAALMKQLAQEGFTEVAICGGASVYSMFMRAGVVNKLYITLEPVLFGQGVKIFQEGISAKLKLVEQTKLSDQTLLLEYNVS